MLVRIAAFFLFCLLPIALEVFPIELSRKLLNANLDNGLPSVQSIVMLAKIALTSLLCCAYLISALFLRHRDVLFERVEVTRTECPRLFAMLDGLVRRIGALANLI